MQTPEMQKNIDGSVDVTLRLLWARIRTGCLFGGGFEVMFCAYAPTKTFFDKAWMLSDIEEMS
jgi:hypothetical protein